MYKNYISIHALRVEGDNLQNPPNHQHRAISIHALRVEGDFRKFRNLLSPVAFLSTPSGWRATFVPIQIHSVRMDFYPRPPGGGRLAACTDIYWQCHISIHALRVEGDSKNGQSFRLFLRKREKNLPL